jgi:hypothetical protein
MAQNVAMDAKTGEIRKMIVAMMIGCSKILFPGVIWTSQTVVIRLSSPPL